MKLTRRQETFVHNLLDLYREMDGPIHYSLLAERVGVSPVTAYDMLRLLEVKGLVTSEYRVATDKRIPGRSEIVFRPTEQARLMWVELTSNTETGDGEKVKKHVLERIHTDEWTERELAEEMLSHIPKEGSPIVQYCLEIMTIFALRLKRGAGRKLMAEYLQKILAEKGGARRVDLSLLSGFALGILAEENVDDVVGYPQLLEYIQRYQVLILDMDGSLLNRLAYQLAEVFIPLARIE